jgi:hypothetical protein
MATKTVRDLSGLLVEAQDPKTGTDRLKKIWSETKSFKVRKAVTLNPNCSIELMQYCARLYPREVLMNGTFELMGMFGTDDTIVTAKEAYDNPDKICHGGSALYKKYTSLKRTEREFVRKAMIVSPNITSKSFKFCFDNSDLTTMKRELRDPQVLALVKKAISTGKGVSTEYQCGDIIRLYNMGVVDKDVVYRYASGNKSNYWGPWTTDISKFVLGEIFADSAGEKSCKFLSHNIMAWGKQLPEHLGSALKKEKLTQNQVGLVLKSCLTAYHYLTDYYCALAYGASKNRRSISYNQQQGLGNLYDLIMSILGGPGRKDKMSKEDIIAYHDNIVGTGAKDMLTNFNWSSKDNRIYDLCALNECPDHVIELLVTLGLVGTPVLHCKLYDNIVRVVDRINEETFTVSSGAAYLFRSMDLDYIKCLPLYDNYKNFVAHRLMASQQVNLTTPLFNLVGFKPSKYPSTGFSVFAQELLN